MKVARRLVLEVVGWLLLVAGVAAIFLPGPGLLMMVGGLVLLSQQYDWAERRLEPLKLRALKGAAEGVETWPRVIFSLLGIAFFIALGITWILRPPVPGWWSFDESWWLPGGLWTGITQIASALIGLVLLVYSFRRFHGKPEAVAALEQDIEEADDDLEHLREEARERHHRADS